MQQIFTILSLTISTMAAGQNLVPDGSFEQDTACPQAMYVYNNLYWKNPTTASPDYYDTCSTTYFSSVPNNYMGQQNAYSGGAYVGIVTKAAGDYQEYVQVALTNSLTAGRAYCVNLYVSLAGRSAYATKGPQVFFSNSAISSNSQTYLQNTPQISSTSIITDTTNWVLISGTYNAIGGERYITLGNFYSDANTPNLLVNLFNGLLAYYYLDNVSVVDCGASGINELNNSVDISIFPNPSNSNCTISFSLHSTSEISLGLFDMQGKLVKNIAKERASEGNHQYEISLGDIAEGVYFCHLSTSDFNYYRKLIVIK